LIGNRIYGCDDCLAVCPWNKFAEGARAHAAYAPREAGPPLLAELAGLDDAGFRARFAGSPVKRIGRSRFLRNVAVGIGNSGLSSLLPSAELLSIDPDPLIRAHGVWALSRLLDRASFEALRRDDPHPMVAEEWEALTSAAF
ncbi:MAG: epoxyqueuosine reductase, partial [Pseudomonadota bacterium]